MRARGKVVGKAYCREEFFATFGTLGTLGCTASDEQFGLAKFKYILKVSNGNFLFSAVCPVDKDFTPPHPLPFVIKGTPEMKKYLCEKELSIRLVPIFVLNVFS